MKRFFLSLLIMVCVMSVKAQADSSLKEYTGRYVFPDGNIVADVTVILDGEELSMTSSAGTSGLTKLGVDSFSVVEFGGIALFKRTEEGKINGVHIEAAGYIMDGVKEESSELSYRYFVKPSEVIIVSK